MKKRSPVAYDVATTPGAILIVKYCIHASHRTPCQRKVRVPEHIVPQAGVTPHTVRPQVWLNLQAIPRPGRCHISPHALQLFGKTFFHSARPNSLRSASMEAPHRIGDGAEHLLHLADLLLVLQVDCCIEVGYLQPPPFLTLTRRTTRSRGRSLSMPLRRYSSSQWQVFSAWNFEASSPHVFQDATTPLHHARMFHSFSCLDEAVYM